MSVLIVRAIEIERAARREMRTRNELVSFKWQSWPVTNSPSETLRGASTSVAHARLSSARTESSATTAALLLLVTGGLPNRRKTRPLCVAWRRTRTPVCRVPPAVAVSARAICAPVTLNGSHGRVPKRSHNSSPAATSTAKTAPSVPLTSAARVIALGTSTRGCATDAASSTGMSARAPISTE